MKHANVALALFVAVLLPSVAIPKEKAKEPKGRLVIVGGGERTTEIMDRFIELAGGRENGRFIILPMASSTPDTAGMETAAEFKSRGVRNVDWLLFNKEQACAPGYAEKLNGATGIWFCGGDQVRHTVAILGTPVHAKLKALFRQGTVMGGTSAGAAIMSTIMITGNELIHKDTVNNFVSIMRGNVETVEGIGFLENVIIDQHFIKRKRLNRLISVVLEHPAYPGVGIDEATAIIVNPGGTCEVMGEGTVVVLDARRTTKIQTDSAGHLAARNINMSIYRAGEKFSIGTNRPPTRPAAR
jgi:cyanophycinase